MFQRQQQARPLKKISRRGSDGVGRRSDVRRLRRHCRLWIVLALHLQFGAHAGSSMCLRRIFSNVSLSVMSLSLTARAAVQVLCRRCCSLVTTGVSSAWMLHILMEYFAEQRCAAARFAARLWTCTYGIAVAKNHILTGWHVCCAP